MRANTHVSSSVADVVDILDVNYDDLFCDYNTLTKISSPLFSIYSLATILVGSRNHRTQFWKGAIQRLFHQSLVAIGPVVSEEKIFM
jgi:hypothetical protein